MVVQHRVLIDAVEVTRFVVTYYAVQIITSTISTVLIGVLPGFGVLLGKGEYERVNEIRKESIVYSWWLAFSVAITILLVNQSFVSLWVNEEVYAGKFENIFIILMSLQMVFLKNDSLIINLALEQKEKVKVTLYSIVAIVFLSLIIVPSYGVIGFCVSLILRRLILNYYYPRIISDFLNAEKLGVANAVTVRGWIIAVLLSSLSIYLNSYIYIDSWIVLISIAPIIFLFSLVVLFYLGFSSEQKLALLKRLKVLRSLN